MPETPQKSPAPAPWDGEDAVKPKFFTMAAQLLDAGNTETPLAVGEHLWLKIKVYAKGGENKLHAHPYQDHSFIVLDGRARFHGPRGEQRELARNDGIFLPAGSYYWFETIAEEPLVLLRVGAVMAPDKHPDTRITADGQWAVRRGRGETFISGDVAYRDGAYYP
ncbi:MAG: cupin domain-containing protein [Alphaproteobacteria bacterium]|nr:cupin domain-containing protein [Pseudomonadota bacterium]TDI68084.1 MAG: cupin domain-containing protein [Alphaproteobacteria bacterium]